MFQLNLISFEKAIVFYSLVAVRANHEGFAFVDNIP